jgi:hypothetical protein
VSSLTLTETVSDAWSTGSTALQDLAASAAEFATDVAVAAAEQIPEIPEKVAELATAARGRLGTAPRRTWRPWVLMAAGIAAVLGVMWWLRRRKQQPAVDIGPDGRANPMRAHTDRAASAVGQ